MEQRPVTLFTLAHPLFYAPIGRYEPDLLYRGIARKALPPLWRLARHDMWFQAVPDRYDELPLQGWKIHVSATPSQAEEVLRICGKVCGQSGVPFKFVCDARVLGIVNSRLFDRRAANKFVTVYPHSRGEFVEVVGRLADALAGHYGPYILTDKRVPGSRCVFYRYGAIVDQSRLTPTGRTGPLVLTPEWRCVPDFREPYFQIPEWEQDPFPDPPEAEVQDDAITLCHGRYTVTDAIRIANIGGVYVAIDNRTNDQVVLKETRPWVDSDLPGYDAISRRQREWHMLRLLADSGVTPRPIDAFTDWEHFFLVEEFVEGIQLQVYRAATGPLGGDADEVQLREYYERVLAIFDALLSAVARCHAAGVILGDLSAHNVIVNRSGTSLKIVDLDGCAEIGERVDPLARLFTPGFTAPDALGRDRLLISDDYYSCGATMLAALWPMNRMMSVKGDAHEGYLRALVRDHGLDVRLAGLILDLMSPDPRARPNPEEARARLGLAAAAMVHGLSPCASISGAGLPQRVEEVIGFILATATPQADDLLFPADVEGEFPLSLAYGACGVAYALQRITGEVPAFVRRWILERLLRGECPPGLFLGFAGMAWCLDAIGEDDAARRALVLAEAHPLLHADADLYYGCAGLGLACLRFWRTSGEDVWLEVACRIADWLLKEARPAERGCCWPKEDGTIWVGQAKGASGIALFLLHAYAATRDERYLRTCRRALEFDVAQKARPEDGCSRWAFPDRVGQQTTYPYLFFGSAGVGTTLLRYMAVSGEQDGELAEALPGVVKEATAKYVVYAGLNLGLAGLGNFLLDCWDWGLGDAWRGLAARAAEGLDVFAVRTEHGVGYVGQQLERVSNDLATGSAGVALFLDRLARGSGNPYLVLDDLLREAFPTAAARPATPSGS